MERVVRGTVRESALNESNKEKEIDIIDELKGIVTVRLKELTFTNGWCDQVIATKINITSPVNKEITRIK